jgi:hypothetical protein
MKRILAILLLVPMLGVCSMSGKDLIRSANLIKNTSNLSKSGVTESIIVKTKDVLDPARGGGKW